MSDPRVKLDLRLSPADGEPDPAVLDDLVRLIRQGLATVPTAAPRVADAPGWRAPDPAEAAGVRGLETRAKHRIEQASAASQADADRRAALAAQPDSTPQLADEARAAAEQVVAAVQRAVLGGLAVRVPDA